MTTIHHWHFAAGDDGGGAEGVSGGAIDEVLINSTVSPLTIPAALRVSDSANSGRLPKNRYWSSFPKRVIEAISILRPPMEAHSVVQMVSI